MSSPDHRTLSSQGLLAIREAAAELLKCPLPFTDECKEAPKGFLAERCTMVAIATAYSEEWPGLFYDMRTQNSVAKEELIRFVAQSSGQTREAVLQALHNPDTDEGYNPHDEGSGPVRMYAETVIKRAFATLALQK
ncbi:MAG: hypothetical protein WAO98_02325 [Alphaproteobacteria bacterium]